MSRHLWRDHELSRNIKRFLVFVEVFGAVFLTGFTTAVALPYPKFEEGGGKPAMALVIDWALALDFWTLMLIGILTLGSLAIVRIYDHRWNPQRPFVVSVLKTLEPDMWITKPEDLECGAHQNRITLFQCVEWPWYVRWRKKNKTSHMLVPRVRIPVNEGRQPKHVWLADDHDGSLSTGIAGMIFSSNGALSIKLPDLGESRAQKTVAKYAELSNDSVKSVKKGDIFSRVIGGLPLQRPAGGRWGVLVLDSCDEKAIDPQAWQNDSVQHRIKVLSSLLAEVK